jgi:hypothetical protein
MSVIAIAYTYHFTTVSIVVSTLVLPLQMPPPLWPDGCP